jgi:hypothetical protein
MPGSPKWPLSLRCPHQNPVYTSPLPHTRRSVRPVAKIYWLNFFTTNWTQPAHETQNTNKPHSPYNIGLTFLSSSSALQLFMSTGLLNYFFPLFPLLRPLFTVLHSHLSQVISRVVFPS